MTSGTRRAVLAMEATSLGVSLASSPRRPRLAISSKGRSARRSTTRFGIVGLPAGYVRSNQAFEMGPQSLEGRENRSKVCRRQPFHLAGLVSDSGDLIQVPTDRAQRPRGAPEGGGGRRPGGGGGGDARRHADDT